MPTVHRARIVLGIDWEDFPNAVIGSKNIQAKMAAGSATFVSPNPSMLILGQQCVDFEQAHEAVVTTKAKGAATLRVAKRDIVRSSLENERAYVQYLCDGSPGSASLYASSAGMEIWQPGKHNRLVLEGYLVPGTPGAVALKAAASLLVAPGKGTSRKRTYLWRHLLPGTTTYVNDDPTPVANTTVTGLPLNTCVSFEVAVKDATGVGEWCQAVSVFVH
jgi:hypothetical protein